jgi:hypothetical protein
VGGVFSRYDGSAGDFAGFHPARPDLVKDLGPADLVSIGEAVDRER